MLKGINIGGKNRLEYLEFLRKKQDENAEMLERSLLNDYNENLKDRNNKDELSNHSKEKKNEKNKENKYNKKEKFIGDITLIDNNDKKNLEQINEQDMSGIEYEIEELNQELNYYHKFKEENDYIEMEYNFYDFNQELLQNRPLEIDFLINDLMNLKGALYLTYNDQNADQIINYSNSEEIFRYFNNKERTALCQSNIGNLQSQLFKYDKAIYHLTISLKDNRLKKFLDKDLSDEFDENDTLLNNISLSFNKNKVKRKNNKLIEKQLYNSKNNYSMKIIGILINSRYNKLIKVYYKFFSLIMKQNEKALNGLFKKL